MIVSESENILRMKLEAVQKPLPARQIESAWHLAQAHGHKWADAIYEIARSDDGIPAMSVHEIREMSRASYVAGELPGIDTPVLELLPGSAPQIVHCTVTGRVEWTVRESGAVMVRVLRPTQCGTSHQVISAEIDNSSVEVPLTTSARGTFYRRHVDALAWCVDALLGQGWSKHCQVMRALYAQALPDEAAA